MCACEDGRTKSGSVTVQSRKREKLTQLRFSEERKRQGENKPGQTVWSKSDLEKTEMQKKDGGMLIDRGVDSVLFITRVKMVLSSLMLH